MEKAANLDPTPGLSRFKNAFGAFWPGLVGGAISSIGMAVLGAAPGTVAGGLVAAAVVGGDAGRTIATVAGMDAVRLLFVNGAE